MNFDEMILDAVDAAIEDHITALHEQIARQKTRNAKLEAALIRLRDCDWIITPHDRMEAVRDIARKALDENE